MKLLILKNSISYTPEAFAYSDFLIGKGFSVTVSDAVALKHEHDMCISFMGFRPFWKSDSSGCIEIHEYHSLSTPPYSKVKDRLKVLLNCRPSARVFLNAVVREGFGFSDNVPFIFRDMGVDKSLFQLNERSPVYDLIYCGSISGRPGLFEEIYRLASMGLRIIVVGHVTKQQRALFSDMRGVDFVGAVSRSELPSYYRLAVAGLNYTPDIYPFNVQTSTKTLEYCAAGLGVVSNKYAWVSDFCEMRGARFLWLDQLIELRQFKEFSFGVADVSDLEWGRLLDGIGFDRFLRTLNV